MDSPPFFSRETPSSRSRAETAVSRHTCAFQQVQAEGVKGADGHGPGRPFAQAFFQPLPQLAGGFVGEGDGGDMGGGRPLPRQAGDAIDKGAGFAGTRPGDDRHRPLAGVRGLTLLGIQAVGGGIQPGGFHGGRPLDGQQRLRRAGRFLPRLIDKQTGLPRQAVDIGGAEDGHFTIGPVVAG